MSKRQTLFIAAGLILTSVFLVVSSSTARLGFALLILIATSVWLIKTFLTSSQSESSYINTADSDQTGSPEVFAVSQLFEATLGGMREGLLVVNKDMRVVAANRAAQRLFNPKLESQRLTELTRNPAIYGAFLDALKGEERSEVKVETHGPERQVFDFVLSRLRQTAVDRKELSESFSISLERNVSRWLDKSFFPMCRMNCARR